MRALRLRRGFGLDCFVEGGVVQTVRDSRNVHIVGMFLFSVVVVVLVVVLMVAVSVLAWVCRCFLLALHAESWRLLSFPMAPCATDCKPKRRHLRWCKITHFVFFRKEIINKARVPATTKAAGASHNISG